MKTRSIVNFFFASAIALVTASCVNSTGASAGASTGTSGIAKVAGDAVVDAATKDASLATKTAIHQTTGYGTDPVEEMQTNALSQLGLGN